MPLRKLKSVLPSVCSTLLLATLTGGLLNLAATPAFAIPAAESPAKMFRGKVKAINPGRYAKAAIEAEADVSGPAQGRRFLKLELPDGQQIKLERSAYKDRGKGSALWRGVVSDIANSEALLTVRDGLMSGRVRIGDNVYEIRPAKAANNRKGGKGNKHVVELLDMTALPACDAGSGQIPAADQPANHSAAALNTAATASAAAGLVVMDVLAVYTPATRSKAGGTAQIEVLIQAAVDAANAAFTDSDMAARFQLVHMQEIFYTTQGDTSSDLEWVTESTVVAALRTTYGADLVSLIVDTPNSCGTAWIQRTPGSWFSGYAFAATDMDCAVGGLTVAHEHGHNMGMEHNTENSSVGGSPEQASYPWSFGYYINGDFRTVMSYSNPCTLGCSSATRFSNPNILYNGVPTGVADEEDNARTGDLTAPIIAAFRTTVVNNPPTSPIDVRIAQGEDDVEESTATGAVIFNSSDLEFGYDGLVGSEQYLGLRFLNVGIPAGAIISSAWLDFVVDETGSATTNAELRGIAEDNASAFTSSAFDVSSRATTAAVVDWAIPSWPTVGGVHTSPDIASLVQAVVDRPGWSVGNAMAFVISATGDRTAEAWDGSPTEAPLLHVEYDLPQPVGIDVLPGDTANVVYPNKNGKVPVAVLSSADFDATDIDPTTLRFGAGQALPADAVTYIDVDAQFGLDAQTTFKVNESGIVCNDTEVGLSGETTAGDPFSGTDTIDASQCEVGGCHPY